MTDASIHKPPPARPDAGKPTPVRELNGEPPEPSAESDLAEASILVDGAPWIVRVLGRSGRASGSTAPLLLIGFWEGGEEGAAPSLEAMVAARTLQELSTEALESAHSEATEPSDPDRKSGFFQEAGQARRR